MTRPGVPHREKRALRAELPERRRVLTAARRKLAEVTAPEHARLDAEEKRLTDRLAALRDDSKAYDRWSAAHPETARRLHFLKTEIASTSPVQEPPGASVEWARRWEQVARQQSQSLGMDLGL